MNRLVKLFGAVLAVAVVALVMGPAAADEDKVPTIKEVMGKVNKGPKALSGMLGKELKAGDPDWSEIQKHTKEVAKLVAALEKNTPKKGEEDSWKQLTKDYAAKAKELDEAAEKKDKDAALAAHKKISGMAFCKSCHSVHR